MNRPPGLRILIVLFVAPFVFFGARGAATASPLPQDEPGEKKPEKLSLIHI